MNSTEQLKLHEIELRKRCLEEQIIDLITATLGLNDSPPSELSYLLDNSRIQGPEEVTLHFSPEDFASLPSPHLHFVKSRASGQWTEKDGGYAISQENSYSDTVLDAVETIYPDFSGDDEWVPVTLLLPSPIKQHQSKILGSVSKWDFFTIQNNDGKKRGQQALGLSNLINDPASTYPLRLYLALKFLGQADVQQTTRNTPRTFPDIAMSLGLERYFKLQGTAELKNWRKRYRKYAACDAKVNTQTKRLETFDEKNGRECSMEEQFYRRREQRQKIIEKLDAARGERDKVDITPIAPVEIDSQKPFYYALSDAVCEKLRLVENRTYPSLKIKDEYFPKDEESMDYTTICLGQTKENDWTSLIRDTRSMRYMLSYLFSMTCGTAITFYVKNAASLRSPRSGISSPTLILPKPWSDLAQAIKKHNSTDSVRSLRELDFDDSDIRGIYVSAVFNEDIPEDAERLRFIDAYG